MTTFQNTPQTTVDEKLARIAELKTIATSAADLDDRLDAEYEIEVLQGEIEIDRELSATSSKKPSGPILMQRGIRTLRPRTTVPKPTTGAVLKARGIRTYRSPR